MRLCRLSFEVPSDPFLVSGFHFNPFVNYLILNWHLHFQFPSLFPLKTPNNSTTKNKEKKKENLLTHFYLFVPEKGCSWQRDVIAIIRIEKFHQEHVFLHGFQQ
jgi:hypothetical protein